MTMVYEAPGVGHWALDKSHLPVGCTPLVQGIMTASEPVGMRRVFRDLGAPLDTLDVAFVEGAMYTRVRPLVSPDRVPSRPPPRWVLKLAVRLHPEMRRRNRTAARVQVEEPWNRVIADWHRQTKPQVVAANLALQEVDLSAVDDAALLQHARDCYANAVRHWELHFWLHGYDLGPLGRYLYEAEQWGVAPDELLSLLEGASPSTTAPRHQCVAIRQKVEAAGAMPHTLEQLRAVSPEVAAAVDEYMRERQWVLFSRYDLDGVTLGERPDLVFASIMSAEVHDTSEAVAARTDKVRQSVPAAHRERFDTLLRQARDAMDLRDDNGPTTAEWPAGLLRRALLAVGERRVADGAWADRALALEITPDELHTTTHLNALPAADELLQRRQRRAAQRAADPPPTLGPAEPPPPDGVLPEALDLMVQMTQTVLCYLGMDGAETHGGLSGSGIGSRSASGVACVADSPEDALDRLEPGGVLVVASTTPAYNLVLALAGAVVTAEGGPMSHAAVLARELGIPAVVGARRALFDIPDGATVEVDPVAGEVRLVR